MSEVKDLYGVALMADGALVAINQAVSALIVTLENMDDDGIQPKGKESPALALNFAARYPMYSDTIWLILRDIQRTLDALKAETDSIYEANRQQKKIQGSMILASPRQIRFMEHRGFQHVEAWTFEEAKSMIELIASNGWKVPQNIDLMTYRPRDIQAQAGGGGV